MKIIPIIGIITLLLFSSISFSTIGKENTNIIYVDDDGTADYIYIQDAIDNATIGDIIYVCIGEYQENIVINKEITLQGEDKENTFIKAEEDTVVITGELVDFYGFTVESTEKWGNMIIIESNYNLIHNNIFISNEMTGELFIKGEFNEITMNHIIGGLLLSNSHGNTISNNNASIITLSYSDNNHIMHNYLSDKNNPGIKIEDCEDNRVEFNLIQNNNIGIKVLSSNGIIIRHNNFIDNYENAEIGWKDHYIWFHNYWGASEEDDEFPFNWFLPLPYPIKGDTYYGKMYNFDWFPAKIPNSL